MILAVDTSLPMMSVALMREETIAGAVALEGKDSRNEKLLPAIDFLLRESGVDRRSIDLLAVTRGPGSFTGVRIGLATVEGLAFATGARIAAFSTHEAAAQSVAGSASTLVWSDAGRGELYVSAFENGGEVLEPTLVTPEQLFDLQGRFTTHVEIDRLLPRLNLAVLTAMRANDLLRTARLDHYADPTPIYVRLAEAEIKLLQKSGR